MTHKQLWVKVNAPVDNGVSEIVSALSRFPLLETVESCEGDGNTGAWVCFRYGSYWNHPWRELAEFVFGYLAPNMNKAIGDDATVRVQVTSSGQIFGELSVRPGSAHRVAEALCALAESHHPALRGLATGHAAAIRPEGSTWPSQY
jgi:hypothetical protein